MIQVGTVVNGPHIRHGFGQGLEAVADQEEGVLHAAVLDAGQHAHPNFAPSPPVPAQRLRTSFARPG